MSALEGDREVVLDLTEVLFSLSKLSLWKQE
jgi:hypothetical protein